MITLFQNKITEALRKYRPLLAIGERIAAGRFPVEIEGPNGLFLAILVSELKRFSTGPSLVLLPTEQEAEAFSRDLSLFEKDVATFPWWGTVPYKAISPQAQVYGERMTGLTRLLAGERAIVVASLRSFLAPVPPPDFMRERLIVLTKGREIDPAALESTLQSFGYLRVPRVSVSGEFALRGEVLDIFSPGLEEATRIVFDFDTIEEIKHFDPLSQTSTDSTESVTVFPVREVLWTDDRIAALRSYFAQRKGTARSRGEEEFADRLLGDLEERRTCDNEELFFSVSFPVPGALLDYLPDDATLFFLEHERLHTANEVLKKEYHDLYLASVSAERPLLPKPTEILHDLDAIEGSRKRRILFPTMSDADKKERVRIPCSGPRSFFGNINFLKEELRNLFAAGYWVSIFSESESQGLRIQHLLKDFPVEIIPTSVSGGFSLPELKIAVVQENEIFGRRRRIAASVKRAKSRAIDTFVELDPGDYVVHVNYGIGRFRGIERIKAAGTERDYIQLEYANEETMFIPIEQVNLVQRFIGQEGREPHLDHIGGKSWDARKERVRRSVEELAQHLVALYARRKTVQGYAFPKDTDWQLEFEAKFPYEETEDQLRCIEEVKADMETVRPMDRLVCGDVGFGKTEVALRAAFKAVIAGKQVAFLAPTTILAEQHFDTSVERFENFPVRIAMLSRLVARADQTRALQQTAAGEIDILVGTHRILQRDVRFKNLGLIVVDEEQRFGVKDKERLKELKSTVDCLTLSATPIPRTLHMSLLKIRDMSLLATPPSNRRPIETFIREYDENVVVEAIRREIERGGQVFYLHNRVETLDHVRAFLQRIIPEVLVDVAHGKMSGHELEEIMHRFVHGAFQVLVATTIIENGIDIPNVNTIIIDRADMYGISQLYQLRGRVGRSNRLAYAYLLYPGERALTEIAMKRLQIISDYTELGSGFKIALKDLEVRGAGNLLGREQHGDILSVGFDMYMRILDEAVAKLSSEREEGPEEVYLELEYSGYIPDGYISESVEKMEVYKKIAAITTDEELSQVHYELHDRFGPLPEVVQSLLSLAEIRIICRKLSISSLKEKNGTVEIEVTKVSKLSPEKVVRLIQESGGNVRLSPSRPNVILMKTGSIALADKSEYLRERLSALV